MTRTFLCWKLSEIKGLTNSMDVEGHEKILKTKAKTLHKIS